MDTNKTTPKQIAEKIYKNLITGNAFEQVDHAYMNYVSECGNIQYDSSLDKLIKEIVVYSVLMTQDYLKEKPEILSKNTKKEVNGTDEADYFIFKYRDESERDQELKFSDFNCLCLFVDETKANKKYSKKLAKDHIDCEFFVSLVSPLNPSMDTGFRYSFNSNFFPFRNVVVNILKSKIKFPSYYDSNVQAQFEYWSKK